MNKFRPYSKFPATERHFTVTRAGHSYEYITALFYNLSSLLLKELTLLSVTNFNGKEEYRFCAIYQAFDRTLIGAEVDKEHNRAVRELKGLLGEIDVKK